MKLIKADLVGKIASTASISKATATTAVNAFVASIEEALQKGEKVKLAGLGVFFIARRKARKGRNPRTGEELDIPATAMPRFNPAKRLKQAVL